MHGFKLADMGSICPITGDSLTFSGDSSLMKSYCGSRKPNHRMDWSTINIKFKTDGAHTDKGFECVFECVDSIKKRSALPLQESLPKPEKRSRIQGNEIIPCGSERDLSENPLGDPFRITSHPGFDQVSTYPHDRTCTYQFKLGDDCQDILFDCPHFSLAGTDCEDNLILESDESTRSRMYCGYNKPSNVRESWNTMNVTFTSSSEDSDTGFECNVYCGSRPDDQVAGQREEANGSSRRRKREACAGC